MKSSENLGFSDDFRGLKLELKFGKDPTGAEMYYLQNGNFLNIRNNQQ